MHVLSLKDKMNSKLPLAAVAMLFSSFFSFGTPADAAEWVRCDSCTYQNASSTVLSGIAPYEKIVFNPAQRSAWKYSVVSEGTGSGCITPRPPAVIGRGGGSSSGGTSSVPACTYRNVAYPTPFTAAEQDAIDTIGNFYAETGGTFKTAISIDYSALNLPHCPPEQCVDENRSAFDVVGNLIVQRDVNEAIRNLLDSVSVFGHILDLIHGGSLSQVMSAVGVTRRFREQATFF